MYLADANIRWERPRNNKFRPYSLRTEALVMKRFTDMCVAKLRDYPRTIQGDRDILEADSFMGKKLTEAARNGLRLTMEEKATLHTLIEATELVSDLLAMSKAEDAAKRIREDDSIPRHVLRYLYTDLLPLLDAEVQGSKE